MEIKLLRENEDGSADFMLLDMSPKELEFFVNKGVVTALAEMIDKEAKEGKLPALFKEKFGGTD
jgi:hypothetical protein